MLVLRQSRNVAVMYTLIIACHFLSSTPRFGYSLNPEEELWTFELDDTQKAFDTQPGNGDPLTSVPEADKAVLKWAVDQGAVIDPRLELKPCASEEQGIGWHTTAPIDPETELIRIPKKLILSTSVLQRGPLKDLFQANPVLLDPQHGLEAYGFAIYILYCLRNPSCKHSVYAQSLTRASKASHLLLPPQDVFVFMKKQFLYEDLQSLQGAHDTLWQNMQSIFAETSRFPTAVSKEEFDTTLVTVRSRLLYSDAAAEVKESALVPVLDLLNHHNEEHLFARRRPRSKHTWHYVNKRNYQSGEQVFGNYGSFPSGEFYKRYAFVPRPLSSDHTILNAPLPEQADFYAEKQALLEKYHIETALRFYRNGTIPRATRRYFRVLVPSNRKELDLVIASKTQVTKSDKLEQDAKDRLMLSLFEILNSRLVLDRDARLLKETTLHWSKRPLAQARLAENQVFMSAVTQLRDEGTKPPPKAGMTFEQKSEL